MPGGRGKMSYHWISRYGNGPFCAIAYVLRPLDLVPITDFTYKYHPDVARDADIEAFVTIGLDLFPSDVLASSTYSYPGRSLNSPNGRKGIGYVHSRQWWWLLLITLVLFDLERIKFGRITYTCGELTLIGDSHAAQGRGMGGATVLKVGGGQFCEWNKQKKIFFYAPHFLASGGGTRYCLDNYKSA